MKVLKAFRWQKKAHEKYDDYAAAATEGRKNKIEERIQDV
jgi:hypothetical protein